MSKYTLPQIQAALIAAAQAARNWFKEAESHCQFTYQCLDTGFHWPSNAFILSLEPNAIHDPKDGQRYLHRESGRDAVSLLQEALPESMRDYTALIDENQGNGIAEIWEGIANDPPKLEDFHNTLETLLRNLSADPQHETHP